MESLYIELLPTLQEAGDSLECTDHIDLSSYELGGRELSLAHGLDYSVVFSHTGEGILLSGLVKTEIHTECDRCLDDAKLQLSAEVEGYYLFEEPLDLSDEEDFELISDDRIDLFPALIAALNCELPYIILCKDDCKGICPNCGANLNHEACSCDQDKIDDHHPFAKLQSLKQKLENN